MVNKLSEQYKNLKSKNKKNMVKKLSEDEVLDIPEVVSIIDWIEETQDNLSDEDLKFLNDIQAEISTEDYDQFKLGYINFPLEVLKIDNPTNKEYSEDETQAIIAMITQAINVQEKFIAISKELELEINLESANALLFDLKEFLKSWQSIDVMKSEHKRWEKLYVSGCKKINEKYNKWSTDYKQFGKEYKDIPKGENEIIKECMKGYKKQLEKWNKNILNENDLEDNEKHLEYIIQRCNTANIKLSIDRYVKQDISKIDNRKELDAYFMKLMSYVPKGDNKKYNELFYYLQSIGDEYAPTMENNL